MQWVRSQGGVEGNERANEGVIRGSAGAFRQVKNGTEVRDIWQELRSEGMR